MAKSIKKSAKKKVAAKKTPIVKLQMRTEKVVSKSGKEYYRPVKQGSKKKKPVKKVAKPSVKKSTPNPLSMSERFNWKKFNKQYTDLYNEIQKDEKALQKKKAALEMIGNHLISIEREFSPL